MLRRALSGLSKRGLMARSFGASGAGLVAEFDQHTNSKLKRNNYLVAALDSRKEIIFRLVRQMWPKC